MHLSDSDGTSHVNRLSFPLWNDHPVSGLNHRPTEFARDKPKALAISTLVVLPGAAPEIETPSGSVSPVGSAMENSLLRFQENYFSERVHQCRHDKSFPEIRAAEWVVLL